MTAESRQQWKQWRWQQLSGYQAKLKGKLLNWEEVRAGGRTASGETKEGGAD